MEFMKAFKSLLSRSDADQFATTFELEEQDFLTDLAIQYSEGVDFTEEQIQKIFGLEKKYPNNVRA